MKNLNVRKIAVMAIDAMMLITIGFLINLGLMWVDILRDVTGIQGFMMEWSTLTLVLAIEVMFCFFTLYVTGAYAFMWQLMGKRVYLSCALGVTAGMVLSIALMSFFGVFESDVPYCFFALHYVLMILGTIAFRVVVKSAVQRLTEAGRSENYERTLIVGAGRAAMMILADIENAKKDINNPSRNILPVGLVDDDRTKYGSKINGVSVLGSTEDIPMLCKKSNISMIVFAIPSCSEEERQRILALCSQTECKIKMLPYLSQLLFDGDGSKPQLLNQVKDIKIEDLLGREPITFDRNVVRDFIKGKTLMVTGGGGSIGSELVRQIADYRPRQVIHRIPAFYCDKCGEMIVSKTDIDTCPKCGGAMRQEEDVLDTWFSSALWPFSTLGWPDETPELKYYYPTSTLVTGYDIIFFWVARMIFSGCEHMKKPPFRHVFIHGIVRDSQGRKMSKSLGNGIDPLEVIDKYGADALRFTLATGNAPGNDMRFYWERVESSRNFANKIWNAARFVLMNLEVEECTLPKAAQIEDKWIISRYNSVVKSVTENLDKFELGVALGNLYDFIWDEFCDWYIELVKPRLYGENTESKLDAQRTLCYVLSGILKLLHPFMPFITEEIFCALPTGEETIMTSQWPLYTDTLSFPEEEKKMAVICDAIKSVRNIRTEMNVPPSRRASMIIVTDNKELFESGIAFYEKLAGAKDVTVTDSETGVPDGAVSVIVEGAKIFMPMDELIDTEKEKERLTKEKERLESEIDRVEKKLSNQGFVAKAPAKLIEEEKAKGIKYKEMYDKVLEALSKLN